MGTNLPPSIAAALARGATLLTPNQRAARTLRRAHASAQQAAGLTLWQPPAIFALETWLATLHHTLLLEGHDLRILLSRTQEQALWRTIIAADPELPALQSPESLANLSARALRLLHLHGGSANQPEFAQATDTRAFRRWALAFDRLCRANSFLTEAQLPATLLNALTEGTLTLPNAGLALVDFDGHPPAIATFLDAIQAAGYPVATLHTTSPAASAQLHTAPDDTAEILAAARHIRTHLQAAPEATIAVVVPSLELRRAAIDRIFAQVLAPEQQPITSSDPPPYEFSLGIPLAHTAPVAAALALLRWPAEPLPLTAISALLLSPYFAADQGPTAPATLAAAQFDGGHLRRLKLLQPELSLEAFPAHHLPALAPRLQRLRRASDAPTHQPYAAWADHFRTLLAAASWAATPDSLTFQIQNRWESILDQLSTLDFHGPAPTRSEALTTLARLARETIFAPESRNAPVQILGPLELGGLPFDVLWFLGADDLTWPPATSPSPLIPFQLQRTLGMPGTDTARDAAHAQALTTRIVQSAPHVVFSFAAESAEGQRRPSSALSPLALTPFAPAPEPLAPPIPALLTVPDTAPPPTPDRIFHGGARILELEAACPFRAFAEFRLQAAAPQTRDLGFDPMERGILVHTIMEAFWTEVESQAQLRALSVPASHELLDRCIAAALAEASNRAHSAWDAAYLRVQHLRLAALLEPWLAVELDRPNFVVAGQERTLKDVAIGPLRLNLRVDRIDQTAGGNLILDYKTGAAEPKDWLSDRPEAPQLPLYAVVAVTAQNAELGGVAFANLRAGQDLALKGFADSPAVLAKSSRMEAATLADQVDQWRDHLTTLAQAFADGDTRVLPRSYPTTCTRCTQRLLCRLDPTTLTEIEEEDTAAPAGYGGQNA